MFICRNQGLNALTRCKYSIFFKNQSVSPQNCTDRTENSVSVCFAILLLVTKFAV